MVSVGVAVGGVSIAAVILVPVVVVIVWKHKRKSKGIAYYLVFTIIVIIVLPYSTTTCFSEELRFWNEPKYKKVYKQWKVSLLWFRKKLNCICNFTANHVEDIHQQLLRDHKLNINLPALKIPELGFQLLGITESNAGADLIYILRQSIIDDKHCIYVIYLWQQDSWQIAWCVCLLMIVCVSHLVILL